MSRVRASSSFEQKIVDNVAAHGCHISFVFDPKGDEPSFAYSVGFEATVNQPEVIIFGLPHEVMQPLINDALRLCRAGLMLQDGVRVDDLLDGYSCFVRDVIPEKIVPEYFNSAIWYHRARTGEPLSRAAQIVWPDLDGLFPWEEGCDAGVRVWQPALWTRNLNS